jgi:fructose-1-phosphate kinase PfkB-like protein
MQDALAKGIACGAATASRKGTTVGTREQVNELLAQVQINPV